MTEPLKPYITPNGGLCQRDTRTIIWVPGEPTVRLSGDFAPDELEAVVEHILSRDENNGFVNAELCR